MAARLALRAARFGTAVSRPLRASVCTVTPSPPATSLSLQRRFISTEADNLRGLLERELKAEEAEQAPMPDPPQGFSLVESGNSTGDITIKSTVGEDEEITVTIEMPTQLRFDESPNLNFLVHCYRKGKGVWEFTCMSEVEADPSGSGETNVYSNYSILGVKMYAEKDIPSPTVLGASAQADFDCEQQYSGPCLTDLEEDLQMAFREFLWERNVDEKVMQFMQYAVPAKESRLYRHWMKAGVEYCTK